MLQRYPHEKLTGPRVELRRHELAVAPEIFRLVNADRTRLGRFLPWVAGLHSVADEEEYLRFAHVQWEEYKLFDYGIFLPEGFVGALGAHHLDWENERAEIGYWIAGPFEGKGYMSEAVALLEKELFRLGFHRLEIRCNPENVRSARVPERLGYRLEGVLKDHKIENGRRRDTMVWAKLKDQSASGMIS